MSGSKSTAKMNEKIEKIHFCTVIKKIGNPLRQLLCVKIPYQKKNEKSFPWTR